MPFTSEPWKADGMLEPGYNSSGEPTVKFSRTLGTSCRHIEIGRKKIFTPQKTTNATHRGFLLTPPPATQRTNCQRVTSKALDMSIEGCLSNFVPTFEVWGKGWEALQLNGFFTQQTWQKCHLDKIFIELEKMETSTEVHSNKLRACSCRSTEVYLSQQR